MKVYRAPGAAVIVFFHNEGSCEVSSACLPPPGDPPSLVQLHHADKTLIGSAVHELRGIG